MHNKNGNLLLLYWNCCIGKIEQSRENMLIVQTWGVLGSSNSLLLNPKAHLQKIAQSFFPFDPNSHPVSCINIYDHVPQPKKNSYFKNETILIVILMYILPWLLFVYCRLVKKIDVYTWDALYTIWEMKPYTDKTLVELTILKTKQFWLLSLCTFYHDCCLFSAV